MSSTVGFLLIWSLIGFIIYIIIIRKLTTLKSIDAHVVFTLLSLCGPLTWTFNIGLFFMDIPYVYTSLKYK